MKRRTALRSYRKENFTTSKKNRNLANQLKLKMAFDFYLLKDLK
ncbi:hypothetical protein NEOC65_001296 [Neochlamydia sp. AcF65]|nr:hypothetical protein [Neochlamydia sp. AcF65]MBS4170352.1 hypothetical protein [Neochlamydia sp. AcF95]